MSTKTLINIHWVPPQPSDAKPKKLFKRNRCHCAETAYHGLLIKKSKQKSPAANLAPIENQLLLVRGQSMYRKTDFCSHWNLIFIKKKRRKVVFWCEIWPYMIRTLKLWNTMHYPIKKERKLNRLILSSLKEWVMYKQYCTYFDVFYLLDWDLPASPGNPRCSDLSWFHCISP